MIEICKTNECTGCESCVSICPSQCIEMKPNQEGFYYPKIDTNKCLQCKKCVNICPNNNSIKKGVSQFYMGWHKSLDVLRSSSSGGAFTAIADFVLDNGGVVFGASFDDENHIVEHIWIDSKEDLYKLRLSKYFQGRINDSYKLAKTFLNEGRTVLFSGTGCQIAGLYQYLGKEYDNLLTTDILCHGITSKKVVDSFINSKEKKYKKSIRTFRFRLKPSDSVWMNGEGTKMRLDFVDGSNIIEEKGIDTFFVGFNNYLFLRQSCYSCKYIGTARIADLTLADYWGGDISSLSESQLENGVSLILANSEKGNIIIDSISSEMDIFPANSELVIPANQALTKPSTINNKRQLFFDSIDSNDFDKLIHKFYWSIYFRIKMRKVLGNRLYDSLKRIFGRF